jgi:hypothetical protein
MLFHPWVGLKGRNSSTGGGVKKGSWDADSNKLAVAKRETARYQGKTKRGKKEAQKS